LLHASTLANPSVRNDVKEGTRDDEKEGKAFCYQNNLLLRKVFKFFKDLVIIITFSFFHLYNF